MEGGSSSLAFSPSKKVGGIFLESGWSSWPHGSVGVGIGLMRQPVYTLEKEKCEEWPQSSFECDQPCSSWLGHYSEGGNQLTNWLKHREVSEKPSIPGRWSSILFHEAGSDVGHDPVLSNLLKLLWRLQKESVQEWRRYKAFHCWVRNANGFQRAHQEEIWAGVFDLNPGDNTH